MARMQYLHVCVFFFSFSGHSLDHRSTFSSALWLPGTGCPVLGCGAKFCRNKSDLRSHWLEKHEEITTYYHCAVCTSLSFKRKSNLMKHIRCKHRENVTECLGKVEFQSNPEFIDPGGLWQPGLGCPVPGCSANVIRQAIHLKIHWTEKHEEIVAKYHCSACLFYTKRKSNLFQHFRLKHGNDISQAVGKVEYQHNREFQDPYPYTLDEVLGRLQA
ncbi:unnamed protein product [Candidula unifasciata]|uniref:C2H2-type domain-containing protein n=1 Tax=Candidula unifasciata TaxID=100452 RepID=A0A8S3YL29_9EUPU|nr:unnamed protein product [Candidula unifasciata]